MAATNSTDVVVAGGGLAGIVTALECLRAGLHVTVVDRDTPERLGGLALWAFGGMALVGTPIQARLKIPDTPERALEDWVRFGELTADDVWPRRWAEYYVANSRSEVHDWLLAHGLRFMPAVNWVERGRFGDGNRLPRYHVLWGTGRELALRMIDAMRRADPGGRLRVLSGHRVVGLERRAGDVCSAVVQPEAGGDALRIDAPRVVLAMGGLNGSTEQVVANWPADRTRPAAMLNGAHPFSDGRLHRLVADAWGGRITHAGDMWNYAAGIPHPRPHFPGHGLSAVPSKSALWLDHRARRIGPEPLVTGFDTNDLCRRVAALEKPYTWHLMNRRIAVRELAISGAEHNPHVRDSRRVRFALTILRGNHELFGQLERECPQFIVERTLPALAARMNALTGTDDVDPRQLQATADDFDRNFAKGLAVSNDDQIRRILHTRQWWSDRLRTCRPAPLQDPAAGPFVAIQLQLVTRKSLGGLQTDLQSRVLDAAGTPIPGLYCVGEAAGFGGGGASGKRSLEGTCLPGCILTARAAARAIAAGH